MNPAYSRNQWGYKQRFHFPRRDNQRGYGFVLPPLELFNGGFGVPGVRVKLSK